MNESNSNLENIITPSPLETIQLDRNINNGDYSTFLKSISKKEHNNSIIKKNIMRIL